MKTKNKLAKKITFKRIFMLSIFLMWVGIIIILSDYFHVKLMEVYEDMNFKIYTNEDYQVISDADLYKEPSDKVNSKHLNDTTKDKSSAKIRKYVAILEVPKVKLKRGLVSMSSKSNTVSKNIMTIKGSQYPDVKQGNLMLASHSRNCYVCFFKKLYKLKKGDKAYVYYKGNKYEYKISDIYKVAKTGTVEIRRDPNMRTLTLITCTYNSKTKQTVYIGYLNKITSY